MRRTPHIIHQQSVEVAFERPDERRGMQDRLAAVYYQQILPELDKIISEFEEGSPVGLTVQALSINCGKLHETNWEDELTASVCNNVRNELRRYRTSSKSQSSGQWNTEFIHFLQTGRFLWDSRKELPADYEGQLTLDKSFLDELTSAFRGTDDTLKRLYHYCSPDFIFRLAQALTASHIRQTHVAYTTFLQQAGIAAATWANAVIGAYHATYCRLSAGQKPGRLFASVIIADIWFKAVWSQRKKIVDHLMKHMDAEQHAGHPPFLDHGFLTHVLPLIADEFPDSAAIIQQQVSIELGGMPEPLEKQDIHTAERDPEAPSTNVLQHHPGTSYYIANAGLVLAYPFITPLLQGLGFLDSQCQFFPAAQSKAAVLFQHLIAAAPPLTDESDLPLNKILAGLQPTSFVDPSLFEYTAMAQRECDDVLRAIIAHWDVLRNTSVAGLRETFLQRDGKLTLRTTGWLLQVDTKGVDVLLASLPWPIGVIKLPWMDSVLHVEWA